MKIIFCILLVLFFNDDVRAETYYSNYSEFSDYSLEVVEASDVVNVETKREYNTYFDVAEGGYYLLGDNPSYYPYINVNIYKDTAFSEWSTTYPIDKHSRLIEQRKICDIDDCSVYHLEFRYKDRLYYHYQEYQKKLDKDTNLKGYIKDESDYITYYRYQTRDKLVIKDSIVITSIDTKLEDFITSTTNYKLDGTIDYLKNGSYQINVVTDFIVVPIEVEVLIETNIESKYHDLLNDKTIVINDLNNKIKNNISILAELEKDYNTLLLQHDNNKKELQIKTEEYTSCKNNLLEREQIFTTKYLELEKQYQGLLLENNIAKKELRDIRQLYMQCENNLVEIEQNSKIKQLELESKIKSDNEQIVFLKNSSLNKENNIYYLNMEINSLQEKLINNEMLLQQKEDILKKLDLCEKVNSNLNNKVEIKQDFNRQNAFYIVFVGILLFFIVCATLKIKSMKK